MKFRFVYEGEVEISNKVPAEEQPARARTGFAYALSEVEKNLRYGARLVGDHAGLRYRGKWRIEPAEAPHTVEEGAQ